MPLFKHVSIKNSFLLKFLCLTSSSRNMGDVRRLDGEPLLPQLLMMYKQRITHMLMMVLWVPDEVHPCNLQLSNTRSIVDLPLTLTETRIRGTAWACPEVGMITITR